jgi:DNA-binding MarR family transcriptional regulator
MSRAGEARYPLGRDLELLERVWRVNHAMQRVSNRMSRELGLTGPQRLIIRCVGRYPGLTASQLAALLHLDRGTVSASLNRLEVKGLLERGADPFDGRRVSLGLTAAGRDLDRPTVHTIEAAVQHLLRTTSEADLDATGRVLAALAEALEHEAERED